MASKFAEYLTNNGIDPRRLVNASRAIERLRPQDRQIRLQRRRARSDESGGDKSKVTTEKPRSGRPVTLRLLSEASEGKPVSGTAKQRLLRAVNRILCQKKKDAVDLKALF